MNHACNCKFCGKNMVVQVDDTYAELGDPFKLLKFAACNRCADLRMKKTTLEECIRKICLDLFASSSKDKKTAMGIAKDQLDTLTRKYCIMVSDWYNRSGYLWDDAFPSLLIEKPDRVNHILRQYWKTFRDANGIKF